MEQKKLMYKKKRLLNCKLSKILYLKLLKNGKISQAQKLWVKCLEEIKHTSLFKNRNTLLLTTLQILGPQVDLRKLRRGRTTIEVPFPITKNRKLFLCFKWFLEQVLVKQKNLTLPKALAATFSEVVKEKNSKTQKKNSWQNQAYKNIRFLRYRWL